MAGPDDTDDNRKVKDLLEPAARAELERWFGLPSFEQVADGSAKPAPPPDDPAIAEYHKRVAEALAAVDPVLLADYERRMELAGAMIKPAPPHVVPTIGLLDLAMIARTVADPRDYERSPDVEDHLSECAPQALLRDLHRPDLSFDKVFEIDPDAARRFDGISMVEQAMATDWRLRQFLPLAFDDGRIAFEQLRAERRQPWAELKLPSRSVTE